MNLQNKLNENFNFVKVKPHFKPTGLILPYRCIHHEIKKSYNVKAMIFVHENLLTYMKSENNFMEIVSGNLFNRSLIYLITSNCSSRICVNITRYLKTKKCVLNMSTFTLNQIIKRRKFSVNLLVLQFILKEICINQGKHENESELCELNNSIDIISEVTKEYERSWRPIGFLNPKGYCYLNSVIQLLVCCKDFCREVELHHCKYNGNTANTKFVRGLFELIVAVRKKDKTKIYQALNTVQNYTTESSFGDDVFKCFMNTLSRINVVFQKYFDKIDCPLDNEETMNISFMKYKRKNPGFVFDNFYGQLKFQIICKSCNYEYCESFQVNKSLPLEVPKSSLPVKLENCVKDFFNEEVVLNGTMKCLCPVESKNFKSISKLTHGPKYLFIYLNRGSYTDQEKNNTFVTCDKLMLNIKTITGDIDYKLISVIDHNTEKNFGHYYCKCNYEQDTWWLINDDKVDQIYSSEHIVTRDTIAFMFRKVSEI